MVDFADIAIDVNHVSKQFRSHSEPGKTFKERFLTYRKSVVEDFAALTDVNFTVKTGETLGVLGHNGSGKSTLLKCIAGTVRPSEGVVRVRGRLSALLELGAGFHPDLTGRENIFLNGVILGFSREHVEKIFDDIVEFSELSEFIDTQVKYYSSGMYARLGFAVAVNLEPDVLLIDEVLAVGDEAFQRKCIERVRGFQAEGRTILLVTHSPEQVRFLCDEAVVLDQGKMIHFGDVNEAVTRYRQSLADRGHQVPDDHGQRPVGPDGEPLASLKQTAVRGPGGETEFKTGDTITFVASFTTQPQLDYVRARLVLHDHQGMLLTNISTSDITGGDLDVRQAGGKEHTVEFTIDNLPLLDGQYMASFVLQSPDEADEYHRIDQKLSFNVSSSSAIGGRVAFDFKLSTDTPLIEG